MSSKKYDWDEIISKFQQSKLSQAEFCRQNQLNAKYLSLQLRKRNLTKPRARKDKEQSAFIQAVKQTQTSPNSKVIIECHSTKIHIDHPDSKWLADFCKALSL